MNTFYRTAQFIIITLAILYIILVGGFIETQIIFGIILLANACISIAVIFNDRANKHDRVITVFYTLLFFMIAQIYTAVSGMSSIFKNFSIWNIGYKTIAFCLNAIMMGTVLHAYGRYNEKNKD